MTPFIDKEYEPDYNAYVAFQEHMNTLEQEEYDKQCEIENAYDYGDDFYDDDDRIADAEAMREGVSTPNNPPF